MTNIKLKMVEVLPLNEAAGVPDKCPSCLCCGTELGRKVIGEWQLDPGEAQRADVEVHMVIFWQF